MSNGFADETGNLRIGNFAQYNAQSEWMVFVYFTCPTHNVFFGIMIEVAFMERRGVHGVEKLARLIQPNFN
jgi:GTP cyclohydrolase I